MRPLPRAPLWTLLGLLGACGGRGPEAPPAPPPSQEQPSTDGGSDAGVPPSEEEPAACSLEASRSVLQLGLVEPGTTRELALSLRHGGPAGARPCVVTALRVEAEPAEGFVLGEVSLPLVLEAGQTQAVPVRLQPGTAGEGWVTLLATVDAVERRAATVVLLASAPQPCLVPVPQLLSFGPSCGAERAAFLYNGCGQPVRLAAVTLASPPLPAGSPAFTLTSLPEAGQEVAPGGNLQLPVRFGGAAEGTFVGILRVVEEGFEARPHGVALEGSGDPSCGG